MRYRNFSPHKRNWVPLVAIAVLTIALSCVLAFRAKAESAAGNAAGNKSSPPATFKVPPLPTGSAQAVVKPGMSDKEWEEAYKETGRPKFKRNTVQHIGGGVERD
jgi:hypothetical protein